MSCSAQALENYKNFENFFCIEGDQDHIHIRICATIFILLCLIECLLLVYLFSKSGKKLVDMT